MFMLKKEINEIKDIIIKIYEHTLEMSKTLNRIDTHENRIINLEKRMDTAERHITDLRVHGCQPIQEDEEITFEKIGEILQNETKC